MKLLTNELINRFTEVGNQDKVSDPLVIAKFFNPTGAGTWYAISYIPEEKLFFGFVSLIGEEFAEYGYFSLEELESFKGRFGLGIERDLYCGEKQLSHFINHH